MIATTGRAAALTRLVLAGMLGTLAHWLRRTSNLTPGEAAAGASVLLWRGGYVALLLLGPFGLYRPWALRALLAVALALWGSAGLAAPARRVGRSWVRGWCSARSRSPSVRRCSCNSGPRCRFMDMLPYVASTEKIVTFQYYDPLANNAAGLWSPSRQVPGCDGILSLIALVTGSSARVAITSLVAAGRRAQCPGLLSDRRKRPGRARVAAWRASTCRGPFSGAGAPTSPARSPFR